MTVLRSVELSADLITEVVARIRAAGIEFTYDTGETTVVPMTTSVADDLSDRLREDHSPFCSTVPPSNRPSSPRHPGIRALETTRPPAGPAAAGHHGRRCEGTRALNQAGGSERSGRLGRPVATDGYSDGRRVPGVRRPTRYTCI